MATGIDSLIVTGEVGFVAESSQKLAERLAPIADFDFFSASAIVLRPLGDANIKTSNRVFFAECFSLSPRPTNHASECGQLGPGVGIDASRRDGFLIEIDGRT